MSTITPESSAARPLRDARVDAMTTPHELAQRFDQLRARFRFVQLAGTLLAATGFSLFAWLLLAIGDFVWEWPLIVRRVLATLAGVGLLAGTLVAIWKRCWVAGTSRQAARLAEAKFDSLGQRLRTTLDISRSRSPFPEAIANSLATQTEAICERVGWQTLVPWKATLRWLAIMLVAGVMLLAYRQSRWDAAVSLQRAVGAPIPYTTLSVQPGNTIVEAGQNSSIALVLQGRGDRQVTLWTQVLPPEDDEDSEAMPWEEHEIRLTSLDESDVHAAVDDLENDPRRKQSRVASKRFSEMDRSVVYRFETEIGDTETFQLHVRHPVTIDQLVTEVTPPSYTRLPARNHDTVKVSALQGSKVRVEAVSARSLAQAEVRWQPIETKQERRTRRANGEEADDDFESILVTRDGTSLTFELPSERSLQWELVGYAKDSTPLDAVSGRLQVHTDGEPRIRWKKPSDDATVSTLAEVTLAVEIQDDYGISESGIVFDIAGNPGNVLTQYVDAGAESDSPMKRKIGLSEVLPLEYFELSQRDFVSYYAYAVDNHPETPHRVESDLRYLDVRPLKQTVRMAELNPDQVDALRRQRATLTQIISRQRYLINRSRRIMEWDAGRLRNSLALLERHMTSQSDLADATHEVAEQQIARGNDDVDSLSRAEAAMLAAVDSLGIASFDVALRQQQDAQTSLVEARNELDVQISPMGRPSFTTADLMRGIRNRMKRERTETTEARKAMASQLKMLSIRQREAGLKMFIAAPTEEWLTLQAEQKAILGETLEVDISLQNREWPTKRVPEQMDMIVNSVTQLNDIVEGLNSPEASDTTDTSGKRTASIKHLDASEHALELAQAMEELSEHIDALSQNNASQMMNRISQMAGALARQESQLNQKAKAAKQAQSKSQQSGGSNANGANGKRPAKPKENMQAAGGGANDSSKSMDRARPSKTSDEKRDAENANASGSNGEENDPSEMEEAGNEAMPEDAGAEDQPEETNGDEPAESDSEMVAGGSSDEKSEQSEDPDNDANASSGAEPEDDEQEDNQGGVSEEEKMNEELRRAAAAIERQAERMTDLLEQILSGQDPETQQAADVLLEMLKQQPLDELIAESQADATELGEVGDPIETADEQSDVRSDRVDQLRQTAAAIARLARSITAPELERLQELERQGRQFERSIMQMTGMSNQNSSSSSSSDSDQSSDQPNASGQPKIGSQTDPEEPSQDGDASTPEEQSDAEEASDEPQKEKEEEEASDSLPTASDLRQLAAALREMGMEEAADELEEAAEKSMANYNESSADGESGGPVGQSLRSVNEQLRKRIQDILLREFEAGADVPVPPKYRAIVDDYFRKVTSGQ